MCILVENICMNRFFYSVYKSDILEPEYGAWCADECFNKDLHLYKNKRYLCYSSDGDIIKVFSDIDECNFYYEFFYDVFYEYFYTDVEVRKSKLEKLNESK